MRKNETEIINNAAKVVPSSRQLKWQKNELCGIIMFGLNTFTNLEHSKGNAEPTAFFPTDFDCNQWIKTIKTAGFNGILLSCKTEDGFCLWQSKYTDFSVKSSPFQDGESDIVKELSDACRENGINFGYYISPCDLHSDKFGKGKEYDDYFVNLLTELMTMYGDIFEVRFDNKNLDPVCGKHQKYDWKRYYETIRKCQKDTCITFCGPDARHIGNTSAITRTSEWSVVPTTMEYQEKFTVNPDISEEYKTYNSKKMELDLGSRKIIKKVRNLSWYPAFAELPLRNGWYFHKEDEYSTVPLEKLKKIYFGTVGSNCNLYLVIPIDQRGLIPDFEKKVLESFGCDMKILKKRPLIPTSEVSVSSYCDENHKIENALNNDNDLFWRSKDGNEKIEIEITFENYEIIRFFELRENIETGQQIESFSLYYSKNNKWKKISDNTIVGNAKIIGPKKPFITDKVKIVFTGYRNFVTLKKLEIYADSTYPAGKGNNGGKKDE